jgi:hypothetical protein
MTAAHVEDAWMEVAYLSISIVGGSDLQFAAITETLDFDLGEKDIEGIATLKGGRLKKWMFEGDKTITIEAYPLTAGTSSGTDGKGFFDLMHTVDATAPIRIINDRNRVNCRLLVLWTNDPSVTTAQSATAENYSAQRIGLAEGNITSVKPSFTEGILKYTITFKCTAFDKSGDGNTMIESCEGETPTDKLPVIAAYTSSNKFG